MFWFQPLYDVKSFHIFYGTPDREKIIKLAEQDAVIIEASAFQKKDINILKEKNVKVFGYVSLMQLENWNKELKKHIQDTDYAQLGGERIYIKDWDTYVMDIREESYREALLWKVDKYIYDQGLDGIFFDTVDDLDYYFRDHPSLLQEMRDGYRVLLSEIKKQYPHIMIIQNRGFDTYKAVSSGLVEGVLWEGFDAVDVANSQWAEQWLSFWNKEQRWRRVRIFTVVSDEKSRKLSEQHRFPAYMRKGDTYQD